MPQILLATQSYVSHSIPLSCQRLINAFMETTPPDAKSQVPLFGIPGMVEWTEVGEGPIRGMIMMNEILYVVSGSGFYSVDSSGGVIHIGDNIITRSPEVVSLAENGTQIVIVNGDAGYIYESTTGDFHQIFDPAFYPSDTVTFYDNYFVFNRSDTNQFFISAILNGNSYDGTDFASAEASAKPIIGITQNLQLLYIFSEDHFEIWYDAGTPDFPFQRYTGGVIWRGCKAPYSIIKQDQVIFFLGNDLVVYRIQGNVIVRVSTHPIEDIIGEEPNPDKIFFFPEELDGHKFVHVTLPTSKRTLSYDTTTQRWHERESLNSANKSLGRWRPNIAFDAYGYSLYGDSVDGMLSKRDWKVYTERGNTIKLLVHSQPYADDKMRLFCSRFELDMETGVGLTTGQGSDPQIMLRYSKDGGKTWSRLQQWRSLGKIGEYLQRIRWLRLGVAYVWVFELVITDPVRRAIIAAHGDFEKGM